MKKVLILLLTTLTLSAFAQIESDILPQSELIDLGSVKDNNENFENYEQLQDVLKDADIVMLGEQSHGDGTTFETKIKLIKYLHEEMGFGILAFESGLYDCNKAWEKIENGEDVPTSLANSIFFLWATTKQFKPLADYIDENKNAEKPLIIAGFDGQFSGKVSENEFAQDLKEYIGKNNPESIQSAEWTNFEASLGYAINYKVKEYDKETARADTAFINILLSDIDPADSLASYWTQVLRSAKSLISDSKLKTDTRDKQMAENLIWLKENNPGKKIICWGATSHFLYNSSEIKMMKFPYNIMDNYYKKQPMMGQYVKDKYGSKVYTVGFIAYQGKFGLSRRKDIKPAKENSLEYLMEKSGYDNCFLSFKNYNSGDLISRPLAQQYMKNNISEVMDGVIFNKDMTPSRLDHNFFLKIYPENKWIKPEPVADNGEQSQP